MRRYRAEDMLIPPPRVGLIRQLRGAHELRDARYDLAP